MKHDAWRIPGCDLSLLKTMYLVHLGLNSSSSVTDGCLLKIVNRYDGECDGKRLGECNKKTDVCRKRQGIILAVCDTATDAGIVALGHGCGQLQSIDLSYCNKVTDAGIIALGHGCGQLQSINLAWCWKVTGAGVVALGHGCGQLLSFDLAHCYEVTDAGVLALGH